MSDGPRERLRRVGAESLSDAELVAVVLGTGARGVPVAVASSRLLGAVDGLVGLGRRGVGALAALPGIGPSKASRLVAAVELGRRIAATPLDRGTRVRSSRDVDAALRPRLAHAEVERFIAVPLDARNRPVGEILVASGGLSACPVAPADVFRSLLMEAAAAVVFVHNHPSGDPSPSPEDVTLTERLCRAGALLGIRVLDHVIIGREGYFSFLDAGLLEPKEDAA